MLAVAAPAYVERNDPPMAPRDLHAHNCIQVRLPWDGNLLPWVFSQGDDQVEIAVKGTLTVNDVELLLSTVLDGVGIGYLPEPIVASHIEQGRLVNLLDGWCGVRSGVFLYHPSRRQTPMPLVVFLKFIEKWTAQGALPGQFLIGR
jgi:DNA-binding transcriptional LysR family regulator